MDFIDKIREPVKAKLKEMNYELVDIEFNKQYGVDNLTVFIHKKGGVSLEDCNKVHVQVDMLLDELDPIPGAYVLNVSSPGLDRLLISQADFDRNTGAEIEVMLTEQAGKKKIKGTLIARNDEKVTLKTKDKEIFILNKDIEKALPAIKF